MFIFKKYGIFLALASLLVTFVFFFSNTKLVKNNLKNLENALNFLGSPMESAFQYSSSSIEKIYKNYINLTDVRKSLDEKIHENMILKNQLNVMFDLEAENSRLRKIANFKDKIPLHFLSCIVYEGDPSFVYKNARVDKGTQDGVQLGMGVVSANGVVGVIIKTTQHQSDILLLTDPNSNFDVIVSRNRRRGILQGGFENTMQFKYFDRGDKLLIGDEIVTSGLTGSFPGGILIGKVKNIDLDPGNATEIIDVEPSVNLEEMKEALILLSPNREFNIIERMGGSEWMKKIVESGINKNGS